MTYFQALKEWEKESKKTKDNLERMRSWIKWGSQVRSEDHKEVEKFTEMVEYEVFGNA